MRQWRVLFTVNGVRTETVVQALTQLLALMMLKAMFARTDAHAFNALEIR